MVIIRVSVDRTRWDSIKISTILNFGISSTSSAPTHTAGSAAGQRRGIHAHRQDEGDCVKAGECEGSPREVGLSLGKLDGVDGLGLSWNVEELGLSTVYPHRYHSSRGKRMHRDLSLDDSGFQSICEEDLEGGCACGGDGEKVGRRRPTPGIAVSLPTPLPSALQTPTDGDTLPLPMPTYLHSPLHSYAHPHPYSQTYPYRSARQPLLRRGTGSGRSDVGEAGELPGSCGQAISMGMFSASRSSVHLPLSGM